MQIYKIFLTFILSLFFIPQSFANISLSLEEIPPAVDANTYTLKITTNPGAKVTVTGGPTELPPVTDSDKDGKVEITVGLSQNKENQFAIRAETDNESSETLNITIRENATEAENYAKSSGIDTIAPDRPVLETYPTEINANNLTISGLAEPNSTVIASKTDGTQIGTTKADTKMNFSITVELEQNKRNRINIASQDEAGNISKAVQAIIVETDTLKDSTQTIENKEEPKEDTKPEVNIAPNTLTYFTDTLNHWAKEYIRTLQTKKIINGKTTSIFAPDDFLTRAELTKIALNAFGIPTKSITKTPFKDIQTSDWFAPFVAEAKSKGIIKGYSDGFRPNQKITRAEAIKILFTTAGFDIPTTTTSPFTDIKNNDWFIDYVAFAKEKQIIAGYSDGSFRPNYPITRGEIAKITVKTIELYETLQSQTETVEETNTEILPNQALYENNHYDFSLQYYKNWFYEGQTGSGDTILNIGFSPEEDAIEKAVALVKLKNLSLSNLGKENLSTEIVGNKITYFINFSDSKHIEISGSTEIQDSLQIMANTLVITD